MTADPRQNERYNAGEAEKRWQRVWDERAIFATRNDDPRPKYYVLEMFPYPSGRIHMGHVRNYTMGDVLARFMRAKGNNVLHPMGWDAFGMPAENAAMAGKVHPKKWTYENIAAMKKQLQSMGLSLDWAREVATCDPSYYKHQQKLFLDFLQEGLVAREYRKVNWDPVDQTVLANEQVIDGRGWRSGAPVEQRDLHQWVFKISDYAEQLLDALDTLDRWPDKVRLMQKNWIGRSEGLAVRFMLDPATTPNKEGELEIFTTRPDTLFGASFAALSVDHPIVTEAAARDPAGDRADVDDVGDLARALLGGVQQMRKGCPRGVEQALQVDRDHPVPVVGGRVEDRPEQHHAGVVDQDVQSPELGHGSLDGGLGLPWVGDVGRDGQRGAAGPLDVVDDGRETVLAARYERDRCALGGELSGGGLADAAAGAGDEDDFVGDVVHGLGSPLLMVGA